MKGKFLTFIAGAALVCGPAVYGQASATAATQADQQSTAQTNSNAASVSSSAGFNAELNTSVDSKKAKTGDPVVAHTTETTKSNGQVVFPKGTKLVGHVTQATARAKGGSDSSLGVVFDKAVMKNGQEVPIQATIQAIAVAPSSVPAPGGYPDSMGETGAPVTNPGTGTSRGPMGGVASTAGEATGNLAATATDKAANVGQAAQSTVNAAGGATANAAGATGGLSSSGQLTSNSRGVFGLKDLTLNSSSNATQGSVITSTKKNVKLDSGTRLLLVAQVAASAPSGDR
jgi:hypothetical protein